MVKGFRSDHVGNNSSNTAAPSKAMTAHSGVPPNADDGVVAGHDPLDLDAQKPRPAKPNRRYEVSSRQFGWPGKTAILRRQIDLDDEAVGGVDRGEAGRLQLLRQAILCKRFISNASYAKLNFVYVRTDPIQGTNEGSDGGIAMKRLKVIRQLDLEFDMDINLN